MRGPAGLLLRICLGLVVPVRSTTYLEGPRVDNAVADQYCAGGAISMLGAAQATCSADPDCTMIHSYDCLFWAWRPCNGQPADVFAASAGTDACTKVKEGAMPASTTTTAGTTGTSTAVTSTTFTAGTFVDGPMVVTQTHEGRCSEQWSTLQGAQAACDADPGCSFLFSWGCEDWAWIPCGGGDDLVEMVAAGAEADAEAESCTKVLISLVTATGTSTTTLSQTASWTSTQTTSSTSSSTASTTGTRTYTTPTSISTASTASSSKAASSPTATQTISPETATSGSEMASTTTTSETTATTQTATTASGIAAAVGIGSPEPEDLLSSSKLLLFAVAAALAVLCGVAGARCWLRSCDAREARPRPRRGAAVGPTPVAPSCPAVAAGQEQIPAVAADGEPERKPPIDQPAKSTSLFDLASDGLGTEEPPWVPSTSCCLSLPVADMLPRPGAQEELAVSPLDEERADSVGSAGDPSPLADLDQEVLSSALAAVMRSRRV